MTISLNLCCRHLAPQNTLDLLVYMLDNMSQIKFIVDKHIWDISKGLFFLSELAVLILYVGTLCLVVSTISVSATTNV